MVLVLGDVISSVLQVQLMVIWIMITIQHQQKYTLLSRLQKLALINKPIVKNRTQPFEPHAATSQQNRVVLLMQIVNGSLNMFLKLPKLGVRITMELY